MAPFHSIIIDEDKVDWHSEDEIEQYKIDEYARLGEQYDWLSDNGTCEPLRYVDGVKGFPANTPLDHPHIIDLKTLNHQTVMVKLRTCDKVATELHHWDPEAATTFFDLKNTCVQYNWETQDPVTTFKHVVYRKGNKVMVGQYLDAIISGEKEEYNWWRQMWFEIAEDGEWKLVLIAAWAPYTHISEIPYPQVPLDNGARAWLATDVIPFAMTGRCTWKAILVQLAEKDDIPEVEMAKTNAVTLQVDGQVKKESNWTNGGKLDPEIFVQLLDGAFEHFGIPISVRDKMASKVNPHATP